MTGHAGDGFRGRLDAVGFVLDPQVATDVPTRVEAWWAEGARLLVLDHRVVLLLPAPVSVRAEHAPGLPLRAGTGGLVEVPGPDGWTPLDPARLPEADLAAWLPPVVRRLAPVQAPSPAQPVPTPPTVTVRPDLRRAARVGGPGAREPGAGGSGRERRRLLGRRESARGTASRQPRDSRLTRALLRTPVNGVLGRRHAAYLARLAERFERRDYDEALATAIGIGGFAAGVLSLRLPGRRTGTRSPSTTARAGGRALAYGDTVEQRLRELYTAAAADLERRGEVLRAAYVLSDLMGQPTTAVELLERHGHHRLAAELAEGHRLDPALCVRLWWQAGDQERAVEHARRHGVFGQAVDRLRDRDPALASVLRRVWVADRQQHGDHVGAIDAAWPDRELWPLVARDLATGLALGGAAAGHALARALEAGTGDLTDRLARELLTGVGAPATTATFLRELAPRRAADPGLDRELASAAALAVVRGAAGPGTGRGETERLLRSFRTRADPLLMADLPSVSRRPLPAGPPTIAWRGSERSGVVDAVAVGGGEVLVALGDAGVRLLRPDGRTRARWDVPAHRLVVADHGARVLLAADRGGVWTVHELDLPLGPPRALAPLRAGWLLDGYDGRDLVEVQRGLLQWLSPHGSGWRVAWTELAEERATVLATARGPAELGVVFATPRDLQVWHWDLPSHRLRERVSTARREPVAALLPSGVRALVVEEVLEWVTPYDHVLHRTPLEEHARAVHGLGTGFALDAGGLLHLHAGITEPAAASLEVPPDAPTHGARRAGDLVTTWSADHVVVVDVVRREVVADLVVRWG